MNKENQLRAAPSRIAAICLAVMLSACAAAPLLGNIGNVDLFSLVRSVPLRDDSRREDVMLEKRLLEQWRQDKSLEQLRVSIFVSNGASTMFRNRYTIILAGSAPSVADRDRAIRDLPMVLGVDRASIEVRDLVKIEGA